MTIANNADDRVITGGSGTNLNGEATLTFNGQKLNIAAGDGGTDVKFAVRNTNANGYGAYISGGGNNNQYILRLDDKDQNEYFRVTGIGHVGILNGSPERRLHIGNSGTAESNIRLQGGGDYAELRVKDSDNSLSFHVNMGNAGSVEKLKLQQSDATLNGTTDGVLNLNTTDSRGSFIRYQLNGTSKVWIGCGQGLGLGSSSTLGMRSDGDIRIRTGSEEHVTITSTGYLAAKGEAGNWIYGNHPSNYTFHQFSSSKNGDWMMQLRQEHHNGLGFVLRTANSGNNEAIALYRENTTTYGFKLYQNGNVQNSNNSYGQLSDITLKENITNSNSQWDDIKAVKVRNYNFKDDPDKVNMIGVVAQEIETVSPKLVWEDKEGLKGVAYSVLYMKAIKALQEAMTRIEILEQENIALRIRVTNLEDN